MFCLETLLGVQSRIIFANTGSELQGYAPELVHHFQTHGSPIMIGKYLVPYIFGIVFGSIEQLRFSKAANSPIADGKRSLCAGALN